MFDVLHDPLDTKTRNPSFTAGPFDATTDFLPVQRFPRFVTLDDAKALPFDRFDGKKATFAIPAFPLASDHVAVFVVSRFDHAVLDDLAKWASHR